MHLGNREPHQPDPVAVQTPPQHGKACAHEALLNRPNGRYVAFELFDADDDVAHHGGEERPLVGETGIDRWLSRARSPGDLVDACAFKSMLHEDRAGRIEDAFLDLARELLWRAPKAHLGALCRSLVHHPPPSSHSFFWRFA